MCHTKLCIGGSRYGVNTGEILHRSLIILPYYYNNLRRVVAVDKIAVDINTN